MSAPGPGGYQVQTLPGMEADEQPVAEGRGEVLTGEQEQAVARRSEPLLLSAAAGSGKTSVLVERFVRAVRDDEIAPGRILAITFTERAAGELLARVRARLLELGDREAARDTEAAFVGTFHGFCARLLRTHPLAVGLDPDFTIIEEGFAGRLQELAFTAAVREFLAGERGEAIDLLAAYGMDRVRGMIRDTYAELRSRGQREPRLPPPGEPSEPPDAEAAAACVLLDELLDRFGRSYEQLKHARAAVDFDDLELLAGTLLSERAGVRAAWSERFELLMVDEFQDTNPRQLAILSALDRGNLFTVGDELQSIYGFRHADVRLFRERREELRERGGTLSLTRNFRGREPLLEVVNAAFAERFADYTPLVAGRDEPPLEAPGPPAVELLITDTQGWEQREELAGAIAAGLPPAQLWRQAEARMLAQRVAELVEGGEARAADVVVLLRASGDLEVFERALQLQGLRTLATVGSFWGQQQIGDLVSYLRALENPLDEEALYGALASPLAGCSWDSLALLAKAAGAERRSAWETALQTVGGEGELHEQLGQADREALASFCARLRHERETASRRTISRVIERAVEAAGYREHVLRLDWGARRLANVHKLLRLARRFESSEGRDLRGFLDHVEYLKQAVKVEPDAPVDGVEPDAVRLMTIHAAKGLEFPVVCLADLGRQPYTRTPDLVVDGARVGLRLARLDAAGSTPALAYEALCLERRRREAEEEDRVLYVAMTRARERLLLSGAVDLEQWPTAQQAPTPISWLAPALADELPALAREGACPAFEITVGAASVRCLLNTPATAGAALLTPAVPAPAAGPDAAPAPAVSTAAAAGPTGTGGGSEPLASLSYSSLSELERCGYRFYLERVLGLAEDRGATRGDAGRLEARARGELVHRLMEQLDFAAPRPPSAADVAGVARSLGMRVGEAERAEIAALIAGACRAAPSTRVAAGAGVRREHPFAFSPGDGEPLITGVIDLLVSEPDGGQLVLDYKSDRVEPGADLGALVEREYGVQRLLYGLAVLREGALAVEIVHWFLERPEEWVGVRFTAADRPALEEQLAAKLVRARERRFEVSPLPHRGLCLTCPGRAGLCSWSEAETLRETPGPGRA